MELFRSLGVAKEIEKTGLPPEWTEHIFWLPNLSEPAFTTLLAQLSRLAARINSYLPVMTAQDLVEQTLMAEAEKSDLIGLLKRSGQCKISGPNVDRDQRRVLGRGANASGGIHDWC